MKHWQLVASSVLYMACTLPAFSDEPQAPSAAAWYAAGHIELQALDAENALTATWQFDRAENGDIRLVKDEQRGAEKIAGTLMSVCEDRALIFKGIAPARKRELTELDQPVLVLQLALKLLARAVPQGPQALPSGDVELTDADHSLRVAKGANVRRDFGAPWQAQVRTHRAGDDIKFETTLSYTLADTQKKSEIKLSGVWRLASTVRGWGNKTGIKDQRVYRVEKSVLFVGGNAQLEPELLPQVFEFDTLGALRTRIEHDWNPDPKAPKSLSCGL